jgi:hypothetical protein
MDRQTEMAHLHKAEAEIESAKVRISRQEELLARLKRDNHDTSTATSVLQTMRETLVAMESHRALIVQQLAAKEES